MNRGFADDLRASTSSWPRKASKIRVNEFLSWELLDGDLAARCADRLAGRAARRPDQGFCRRRRRAGYASRSEGVWRTTPEELRDLVARAAAGLQVAAHAIGDGAIEAMCDAVEAASGTGSRHRVEHCTICPP